jgi:hypothetical protein
MTHVWRHPKYYAELKKIFRSLKPQAEEAASDKRPQPEVASDKRLNHQAPSDSRKDSKSSSDKQQAS